MSVTKTMNTAVAGLRAQQDALGVVGDNIANTNTIGFKTSRAIFEDLLGNVSARRTLNSGAGARMIRAQQIFSQGSLRNTGAPTDMALSGDGFFITKGVVDGLSGNFYTRDGSFTLDSSGVLVNQLGLHVQGYSTRVGNGFGGAIGDISLWQFAALPPKESTNVEIVANLDASAKTFNPPADPAGNFFDPTKPIATSNFSTSVTIFDSEGVAHSLDVYFTRLNTGANGNPPYATTNDWEVHILNGTTELTAGPPLVQFDSTGKLAAASTVTIANNWDPNNPNGAKNSGITFDLGTSIANNGSGLDGVTMFGTPSTVTSQNQDGYAPADLRSLDIGRDGIIRGVYSNGQTLAIAQFAVAKFASNDGLARSGHNLWAQTIDSGQVAIGGASTGGRGAVVSGALEQSNVDVAAQFVDMIAYQRAFSANAKTITTADELLLETVNLKR
jgi:flagellar hook protein FlgE